MKATNDATNARYSNPVPFHAPVPTLRAVRARVAVVLLLSLSTTARADILNLPIPGSARVSYSGGRQVLIPKFDPALGTLTAVSVSYTVQYSGSIGGFGTGGANTANGWSTEFSGTIRLAAPSMGNLDFGYFNSQSGLVFQPGSPVFQAFGPANVPNTITFSSGLASYVGTGNVAATLSWPSFTADLFFSRSGVKTTTTRDLGAIGGQVTYDYIAAEVPEPSTWAAAWSSVAIAGWTGWRRWMARRT
jgi:hypothetical protein